MGEMTISIELRMEIGINLEITRNRSEREWEYLLHPRSCRLVIGIVSGQPLVKKKHGVYLRCC